MTEERAWYSAFRNGWTVRPELTRREMDVLALMAAGHTRTSAARALHLSTSTVKSHLEHLRKKTQAKTTAQIVSVAYLRGWLS